MAVSVSVRPDLASRSEIIRLVDAFYDRVREDDLLGPIFNDVARVDWTAHLPRMYDFWESVLFGEAVFKGNPLAVHIGLADRTPLTSVHFERWLAIFGATVDELFEGPVANEAKARAARIAQVLQYHTDGSFGDRGHFR
jgi:hemoglobin